MTIVQRLITWEAIAGETIFFCGVGWGGLSGGQLYWGQVSWRQLPGGGTIIRRNCPVPKIDIYDQWFKVLQIMLLVYCRFNSYFTFITKGKLLFSFIYKILLLRSKKSLSTQSCSAICHRRASYLKTGCLFIVWKEYLIFLKLSKTT